MEDNFSTDGAGMVQTVIRAMGSHGEQWGAMGSDGERQMKLCSLAAHLLLCCPRGVGDPCLRAFFPQPVAHVYQYVSEKAKMESLTS